MLYLKALRSSSVWTTVCSVTPFIRRVPAAKACSHQWATIGLLAGITLLIGSTAVASYHVVRGLLLDSLKQRVILTTQQGADKVDQWLASRKAEVYALASGAALETCDWRVAIPQLQQHRADFPEFMMFNLAVADGQVYNTKVGKGANVKDREFFRRSMQGEIVAADPVIGRTSRLVQIQVSAPIRKTVNAVPDCVLMGAIRIDRVVSAVNHLKWGPDSYAFALNSQGVAIAHPNPRLISTQELNAPSFVQSPNPGLAQVAQRMIDRQTGIDLIQMDRQWVYLTYVPLTEANWSMALVIPRQTIEAPLRSLNLLASLLSIVLCIAIIGAWRQFQMMEQLKIRSALLQERTSELQERSQQLQAQSEDLQSSLNEKETLLKEIHHRVKNNLQIVTSLLRLQANQITDPETQAIFQESQNRVRAMALVHEKLYQSHNLAQVNFAEYVNLLVREIRASYCRYQSHIQVVLEISPVELDITIANPCGLILNELLSNAFKYAFPNERPGTVTVRFVSSPHFYTLMVQDNGVGLPEGLQVQTAQSLGLRLVVLLSRQLKGQLNIDSSAAGSCFTLDFSPTA